MFNVLHGKNDTEVVALNSLLMDPSINSASVMDITYIEDEKFAYEMDSYGCEFMRISIYVGYTTTFIEYVDTCTILANLYTRYMIIYTVYIDTA